MESFGYALGVALLAIGAVSLIAFLGGTLVYWLWPVAIPAAFPGLVASGTIPASLGWWPSVCLTWLSGLLVRSSQTCTKAD